MKHKIKWKSEFQIGIATIDRQHHEIFERLLAIESSIKKRDPWHVQRFLIREFVDYLKYHFAVEESMLEILGYPQYGKHAERHADLVREAAELEARIEGQASTKDLVVFFEGWFIRHVLCEDADYVDFARQLILKPAGRSGP